MLRAALALIVIALLALAACGGASGGEALDTGDMTITFAFGGRSCDEVGVDRILLDLVPDQGTGGEAHEITCDEALDAFTLFDVDAGFYRAAMQGLGPDGDVRYQLRDAPFLVVAGDHGGTLLPAPGETLHLSWTVDGGACGDVEGVSIDLQDPDGREWDLRVYPCSDHERIYQGLYPGTWTVFIAMQDYRDGAVATRATQPVAIDLMAGEPNDYAFDL